MKQCRQIAGNGTFATATLLIDDRNNLHLAIYSFVYFIFSVKEHLRKINEI
jgi:hypothetical protein